MPSLPPKYAVYWVNAQPGVGSRRAYVGYIEVARWGSTVAEAVKARADFHMKRPAPKGSAAWLRPCTDAKSGLMATTNEEDEALKLELFWTLRAMDEQGQYLARGACFVRVAVPWGLIVHLKDFAKSTFPVFCARLAAAEAA